MIRKILFILPILYIFSATSCSQDKTELIVDQPWNSEEEKVRTDFNLVVKLELDEELTRGVGEPGFGNGNQINNLVYALYTQESSLDPNVEGEIKPVILKYENEKPLTKIRVDFDPSKENRIEIKDIDIIKGIEYTLMLWAQYRPAGAEENKYFSLRDDGIIRINYYEEPFPNNDDQRDVFCAIYKLMQYEDDRTLNITLRRPFAQLNVGVEEDVLRELDLMDDSNLRIDKSSIVVTGDIANKYNLFKNIAEIDKDDEGNNIGYHRVFSPNTIPSKSIDNGYEGEEYKYLTLNDADSNPKSLIWLSMCYILPNEERGYLSLIDLEELNLYAESENDENDVLVASVSPKTGIPLMRNRRTNIILGKEDFIIE